MSIYFIDIKKWRLFDSYKHPKTFFRIFFSRIRIRIMTRIRISQWNSFKKVMLHILKIPTKFDVVPQSFCQNQHPVQDQNQDRDHDFTLDFNTRPTFHTYKKPIKFCFDPLTLSKVNVSTARVHVRTYSQTDRHTYRRTDIQTGGFFFQTCDYYTFSFYEYILRM